MLAALALLAASACGGPSTRGPPTAEAIVKQRLYSLRIPPGADAITPLPLVIGLHGYGDSSGGFEAWWQLGPEAAARGVLYVALDGTNDRQGNQVWNAKPRSALPPYDLLYIGAVIDDVAKAHPLDRKRVYVVGSSNGAFMAYRAACELSSKVAAVLSLSGQGAVDDTLCPTTEPVSVAEVHGDRDATIAYDGRDGPSSRAVVTAWGARNGCTGQLMQTSATLDVEADLPGSETTVAAVAGCPEGAGAELWTVKGGEHHPNLANGWARLVLGWLLAHGKK